MIWERRGRDFRRWVFGDGHSGRRGFFRSGVLEFGGLKIFCGIRLSNKEDMAWISLGLHTPRSSSSFSSSEYIWGGDFLMVWSGGILARRGRRRFLGRWRREGELGFFEGLIALIGPPRLSLGRRSGGERSLWKTFSMAMALVICQRRWFLRIIVSNGAVSLSGNTGIWRERDLGVVGRGRDRTTERGSGLNALTSQQCNAI